MTISSLGVRTTKFCDRISHLGSWDTFAKSGITSAALWLIYRSPWDIGSGRGGKGRERKASSVQAVLSAECSARQLPNSRPATSAAAVCLAFGAQKPIMLAAAAVAASACLIPDAHTHTRTHTHTHAHPLSTEPRGSAAAWLFHRLKALHRNPWLPLIIACPGWASWFLTALLSAAGFSCTHWPILGSTLLGFSGVLGF